MSDYQTARSWFHLSFFFVCFVPLWRILSACWDSHRLFVFANRRVMIPMRATWTTARLLSNVCS